MPSLPIASDLAAILAGGDLDAISGSYSQGGNSKSVSLYSPAALFRVKLPGELERSEDTYWAAATEFASGFSGTNPVVPSDGDRITIGSTVYRVLSVTTSANGALYVLEVARRSLRGTA